VCCESLDILQDIETANPIYVQAAEEEPPVALLDFYGPKYFDDEFWRSPLPMLSQLPDFPEPFLLSIFQGPLPTYTNLSLEKVGEGSSKAADGKSSRGIPKPDLSVPRNAWLFTHLKRGTHLQNIVQDGKYDRVDPVTIFSKSFPPTMFIHGDADTMVPTSLSLRAHSVLQALGVDSKLVLVPNASHGFEIGLPAEEPNYQYVAQGIDFLKQQVLA
jgi:pimeloyl-ACP methyl ester carboxylesterase